MQKLVLYVFLVNIICIKNNTITNYFALIEASAY